MPDAPNKPVGADESPASPPPPRLLDQIRARIRYKHYSLRTERAYVDWARRFILFHGKRHPRELGPGDVERFLSHLANERNVAASTHQQALAALLFLYGEVLQVQLPWLAEIGRPKKPKRLPVVLTADEVRRMLAELAGERLLIARLIYGTGMRLMECLRLRVKDVDLARGEILVRNGKGGKDRVTMLPRALSEPLRDQLRHARNVHDHDRDADVPGVELPHALAIKYRNAAKHWIWFWVFPASTLAVDPRTHVLNRGGKGVISPLDRL